MYTRIKADSLLIVLLAALGIFFLSGCGSTGGGTSADAPSQGTPAVNTQGTSTTTTSPNGDIPDTQAFVKYRSAQDGYELEVPEGWAQTILTTGVRFTDKLNAVQVQLSHTSTAPTVESVRSNEATALQKTGNAVQDVKVQNTQVNGNSVILIVYTATSDANVVTGKQIRLENNRYLFFHNGTLAALTLSAPLGADNVDQWARMSRSFRWV